MLYIKIKNIIRFFCQIIINILFVGHHLWLFKRILLRIGGVKVGKNVKIVGPIYYTAKLSIGNNCFIGRNFQLHGNGQLIIEDSCDIAPDVSVLTGSHELGNKMRRAGNGKSFKITIRSGCWIGARVTILGNTTISESSVIGTCSLVNKSIPANVIAYGIPAKIHKNLL